MKLFQTKTIKNLEQPTYISLQTARQSFGFNVVRVCHFFVFWTFCHENKFGRIWWFSVSCFCDLCTFFVMDSSEIFPDFVSNLAFLVNLLHFYLSNEKLLTKTIDFSLNSDLKLLKWELETLATVTCILNSIKY